MKINLAMIVRNEERCLRRSLEAAASFVDDIIIVDTGSTDQTKKIARAFGEKSGKRVLLYDFAWTNDFSATRNFSLLKSETDGGADYSLVIDADERLRTTKQSNREGLETFIRETEEQRAVTLSEKRDSGADEEQRAVNLSEKRDSDADSEENGSNADTEVQQSAADDKEKESDSAAAAEEKTENPAADSDAETPSSDAETLRSGAETRSTDPEEKETNFSPAGWCGAVRLIEERKGRRGEPLTCLRIIPRLLPRGARFRGIVCETPNDSAVLSPLLMDHEEYDREKKAERRLPYLIHAMAAEPEEPFWKYQMAATLVRLGRTEESLPYFEDFYRMLMARYPDVTDQSAYREPYARQGILAYLYALDEMRGEKYRQRALHILLRQEPHMHSSADFYFFCGDFFMELVQTRTQRYITYLPRVEQSFVRCLQIGENTEDSIVIGNGSFRAFYRLGVWYELTNQPQHARACYESAAQMGYEPAMRRMEMYKR